MTFQDDLREVLDNLSKVSIEGAFATHRDIKLCDKSCIKINVTKDQALSQITKLVDGLIGEDRSEHTGEDELDYINGGYNQRGQEIRERL